MTSPTRDLAQLTNRFANVLAASGVAQGDRVFVLAGRIPELYIAALGTLKNRSVFCPLFSAFGPEPIRARMAIGEAKVLVTTESLYRRKVEAIRDSLPASSTSSWSGTATRRPTCPERRTIFDRLDGGRRATEFAIGPTDPEDMALLHFTSGTTGTPKGAVHVHEAVVAHHVTGKLALDLHPDDLFWCTADPGWVTGTSYGIIAPLTNGITSIIDEADFDAERWYRILQDQKVTVWYTAPTAIRMMMKAGAELVRTYDLGSLRFLASVGEPLNPEAVVWGRGGVRASVPRQLVADRDRRDHGRQLRRDGHPTRLDGPAAAGDRGGDRPSDRRRTAWRSSTSPTSRASWRCGPGWPSMFRGYWNEPERYASASPAAGT